MQIDSSRPFFTVQTPTYNRAEFLTRLWQSLCDQTYRNFEWVVADDGSDDGTVELLANLKMKSPFSMTIIAASKKIGKTKLDNQAIHSAKGFMVVFLDSDDVFTPDALELIHKAWHEVGEDERENFCGITALCADNGQIVSSPLPFQAPFDSTWVEMKYRHQVTGDMSYSCRTDILRAYLPPEVDFYMAESAYRVPIGTKYKTRVIDKVVKLVEYNSPHCISFSGKIKYCRGYLHASAICWAAIAATRFGSTPPSFWELTTYFRYAIHGDISRAEAHSLIPHKPSFLTMSLVLLSSSFLAFKDNLQGKVHKTHLEFDNAIKSAELSYK